MSELMEREIDELTADTARKAVAYRKLAALAGLVLVIAGLIVGRAVVVDAFFAVTVDGYVVDNEYVATSANRGSYYPVVTFTTAGDHAREIQFVDSGNQQPAQWKVGQKLSVTYDADDPEGSAHTTMPRGGMVIAALLALAGTVLTAWAVLSWRGLRRSRRTAP